MNGFAKPSNNVWDVVIIGAGISGINSAYRVQTQLPSKSYTILEARGGIGGTWDLFKYPGIRSDSDLHTFGFPWRPWQEQKVIADGASIVKYVRETASMFGIDQHIQYHHKVTSMDWSSDEQSWTLTVLVDDEEKYFHAKFIILSTGYYDYAEPMPATIPGMENFQGTVVHPQFWPEDLDYTGKKMVIIGSGATAVTLLPSLAEKASHVTMLQRSPGYLLSLPNPGGESPPSRFVPRWLAAKLNRLRFLVVPFLFFHFCKAFPGAARKLLRAATSRQLPTTIPHDPHFEPAYNPWEQRMCVCPNGDFYKSLRKGRADIATGTIRSVGAHGITLDSGQELDADIIVTATGLKIQLAGGAKVATDHAPLDPARKFLWQGVMLQDMPNAAFVIGYTNASWTLGADATALLVCRLLKLMERRRASSVVPRLEDPASLEKRSVLNLSSTYVMRALDQMPMAGDKGPWKARDNYFTDLWKAKFGDIQTGLQFYRVST
ncbi:MAG: hypothetical protein M1821_002412 [Bathelium mastoideum]|nr:MAG: hypothetical protein M1821_002412 [Bathelium mastoideum]KAI9686378.1 MAG: hypothetical protein M1822_003723 [Bathelium mastoideum]